MKKRKADLNLSADESLDADNHSEVIDSLYEEIKTLKVGLYYMCEHTHTHINTC